MFTVTITKMIDDAYITGWTGDVYEPSDEDVVGAIKDSLYDFLDGADIQVERD